MKKVCTKCNVNKALEDYYKDTRHKDGRASECKSCHAKYEKSDKGILAKAKYEKSDKGKLTRVEYQRSDRGKLRDAKYHKSDKGILARAKYFKSDRGKLIKAKYAKSDEGKLTQAKYMKSDKGKLAKARINHNRRSNEANTISDLALREINIILFLQNYQCIHPDHKDNRFFDILKPTTDHIKPLSKGGDLIKENVQYLCRSCNSKKHTKYIDYRTDTHKEIIERI
jgi:5-methylcytosine-specific restriction endonuclease McrA